MSLSTPAFFLRFDEGSGSAVDSSGNGRDFTATNTPGTATGVINSCRTCRVASSQYFSRANEAANTVGAGDFTCSFFAKMASEPTFNLFPHKGVYPAVWEVYYKQSDDRFHLAAFKAGPTGFDVAENNLGAPTTGVWYHFFIRRTGSTWSIQINMGAATTGTLSGDIGDTGSAFFIGNDNSGSLSDMDIDLFGFWHEYLADADGTTLYGGSAGYDPTATVGHPAIRRLSQIRGGRPVEIGRDGVTVCRSRQWSRRASGLYAPSRDLVRC